MGAARFVRRITPPILLELFDKNSMAEDRYFWDGIYSHYRDVPTHGERFDGDEWINKTRVKTERLLAASRESGSIPKETFGEHALLPLLASVVSAESGKVRILDFGGGMGVTYIHLTSSVPNCNGLSYHVVEREGIARGGAELFAGDDRIHFLNELPAEGDFDIIYMSSALQYIEDYPSLLRRLMAYGAKYFLFVKLSSGDFPTYATIQKNVAGTTLPYWFINVGEIIELMSAGGYSLIYKGALEQHYDQSNFPPEYRMDQTCNLLFSIN